MVSNTSEVLRFRDSIDATLESNAALVQARGSIPLSPTDYRQSMTFGTLSFASVDTHDVRLQMFGRSEGHLWGIGIQGISVQHRVATLAVVSHEQQPESLSRILTVDSGYIGLPVRSTVELSLIDDLRDAANWASSPLLFNQVMLRLSAPSAQEQESISSSLKKYAIDRTETEKGIDRLLTQRGSDALTAGIIVID